MIDRDLLQLDPAIVQESSEVRFQYLSNLSSLSATQRGEHEIENQLIFKSNPQFIFHDSRGFESGSIDEMEKVNSFITKRAESMELAEQLHAIWCGC